MALLCFVDWSFKLKLTRMKKISLDNNTVAMNLVKKRKSCVCRKKLLKKPSIFKILL